MVTAGGDGLITILFWGVVFVVGAFASAAKKKRQQREALETQEQLRRVDEAIRNARQRAPAPHASTEPVFAQAVALPEVAYGVTQSAPQVLEVASPAFRPATFAAAPQAVPVAPHVPEEGPARPGAWELARMEAAAQKQAPSQGGQDNSLFAPPTRGELREAVVWREIFSPCKSLRARPW